MLGHLVRRHLIRGHGLSKFVPCKQERNFTGALSLLALSAVSFCQEEEQPEQVKPVKKKWTFNQVPNDYMAVFLDEDSVKALKERFPVGGEIGENKLHYDHMTVVFQPSEEKVLADDDMLTEECVLHVIGIAKDEHCSALLVVPENPHIISENSFPHITLYSEGKDHYESKYSNILFHRLADEPAAVRVFKSFKDSPKDLKWEGDLPLVPGIYPSTRATFINLEHEQLTIRGTYCLASTWDSNDSPRCTYQRENECSFCKFMKGGPCRKEFIAWENCINIRKDEESSNDFVDRCGNQTIDLKNCCDQHEYYSLINNDESDDTEEELVNE